MLGGVRVRHIDELPQIVAGQACQHRRRRHARRRRRRTPPTGSSRAGVTSILNFAPVVLAVPRSIEVRKVDLAVELQILSYYEQRRGHRRSAAAGGTGAAPDAAGQRVGWIRHVDRRHRRQPPHGPAVVARAAGGRPERPRQGRSPASSLASNVREAVVLSTCNRTEVYAVAERFHGAYADIRDFFCELGTLDPDELHPHLYSQHDEAAVAHLFEVAAGLDSAVLGESEILGQVRDGMGGRQGRGWRASRRSTCCSATRSRRGKRARTETGDQPRRRRRSATPPSRWPPSGSGTLAGRRVLVVGAGEMGEGVAVALLDAGASDDHRRQPHAPSAAADLAARVGGRSIASRSTRRRARRRRRRR